MYGSTQAKGENVCADSVEAAATTSPALQTTGFDFPGLAYGPIGQCIGAGECATPLEYPHTVLIQIKCGLSCRLERLLLACMVAVQERVGGRGRGVGKLIRVSRPI